MAKNDMSIVLGGFLLPKYSGFKRVETPNEKDNTTLGGTLSVDFINNRRAWKLSYKLLTEEQFNIIHDLYLSQYSLGVFHPLQFDVYGIYTPVKIEMSEQDIKYSGGFVQDLDIILKEKYAFS